MINIPLPYLQSAKLSNYFETKVKKSNIFSVFAQNFFKRVPFRQTSGKIDQHTYCELVTKH